MRMRYRLFLCRFAENNHCHLIQDFKILKNLNDLNIFEQVHITTVVYCASENWQA